MKKISFVASSGGHWEEIMCLTEIIKENDCFFVTEDGGQAMESKLDKVYTVPQINRHEKGFWIHFIKLFFKAYKIIKREKPQVLITTGALIAFPFCVCAKLMKSKIIYIESFARVNNASLSGKLVYPIADLFLVQWESMVEIYPKSTYTGGIF